ncbi:putative sugar lactone lactonase YvrE [Belonocnema kinseyi]|uniref:putative sugar lactone lactonase YvrE n=1 Tax=Belonocnema kinseyi TaxID=2817044 RepID=UPI00143DDA73|nr:putative sugar lactone lactonase YvrE [Belonocnema kinseyi]
MGYLMNLKIHFLHSHIDYFPENLEDFSEEKGERFHQDLQDFARRYQVTTNDHPERYGYNLGTLYSLDRDKKFEIKFSSLSSTTGGFAWGLPMEEGATRSVPYRFYFSDKLLKEVVLYDFMIRNGGQIKNNSKKLFNLAQYGLSGDPGRIAIDERGWLWVPIIGGGGVVEFDPFTKTRHDSLSVPAAKVGACTFGGHDLDILYVSTIGYEYKLPHQHRPKGDQGGHVYAFRNLGVRGTLTRPYFMNPAKLPKMVIEARARRAQAARLKGGPNLTVDLGEGSSSNF